jgi:hypothetical protein
MMVQACGDGAAQAFHERGDHSVTERRQVVLHPEIGDGAGQARSTLRL